MGLYFIFLGWPIKFRGLKFFPDSSQSDQMKAPKSIRLVGPTCQRSSPRPTSARARAAAVLPLRRRPRASPPSSLPHPTETSLPHPRRVRAAPAASPPRCRARIAPVPRRPVVILLFITKAGRIEVDLCTSILAFLSFFGALLRFNLTLSQCLKSV